MKTKQLYYENIWQLDFEANIIEVVEKDGQYHHILDQSAFYPEGGGMASDKGFINDLEVIKVYKKNDIIYHVLDQKLQGNIEGRIDGLNRTKMIQFHDAQHILSAILEKDYGLATVSHHVHEFDCDLFLDGPITEQVMNEVELKANQLIYEHKRLDTLLINKEDLIKYNIEDKDIYTNPVRITNIESLDDFNACGCMHFNNLSYVQMIKCFKVEKVNKDYKLLFSAGISLSNYFNVIYDNYREVQKVLKANDDNYLERFNSINNKSIELTKKLASYKEEYYKEVIKDVDSSFFIYEVKESEDLRILATLLINKERPIKGYLYYQNENAYQFCIFKQTDDEYSISDLLNRLKEDYQINGGGKGLIISGQTNEDLSSIILDYIS